MPRTSKPVDRRDPAAATSGSSKPVEHQDDASPVPGPSKPVEHQDDASTVTRTPSSIEPSSRLAARAGVTVLATVMFAMALLARERLSVWIGTGLAALLSLGLALHTDWPLLRARARPHAAIVLHGLLGAALLSAATYLAYPLAADLVPGLHAEVHRLYALLASPPGRLAATPLLVLVVITEECVWRGLLFESLQQRYSRPTAVAGATACYALPQLASGSWVLMLVAVGCGLLWTLQRAVSGSLVPAALTHLGWDLMVFTFVPLV